MASASSKVHEARVELYRSKGKIHHRAVAGRFNTLRWTVVWITQLIFYGACWLNWERNGEIQQAVWFDIAQRKFHFFGLSLWPQDALLLAFALIVAAAGLFLVTALAGRLFCGFACPQTVYTSIFAWVEARVEGDHLARRRLDAAPWTPRKALLRTTKHGLWALIALWSAITYVGYFTPVRELLPNLAVGLVGPWEGFWLLFYAGFMYVQAGLAREAVCQHMCPYSRFQGVMVDERTRNVSYDAGRGEPRRAGARNGACVDCGICVQACPVGIDIRDGLQYPCINCGLCIDACDTVMDKLGAPHGLVRFASALELGGARGAAGSAPAGMGAGRPRVWIYAALMAGFIAAGLWVLAERPTLRVDVLRDRGTLLLETQDGRIENGYTLHLANLVEAPVRLRVEVAGLPGAQIVGERVFDAGAGTITPMRVTVSMPAGVELRGVQPLTFLVGGEQGGARVAARSTFILP
ncbi:cytochrome c oxidase accessory protein CcoG [Pseudothauera nasutitermitis]|uniref:Cytochrome c oxidase accessory protein CcoG n=1 Tax=Pseudothauera nasutitermitis TaxID=2565930 RepID=A0A4S4APA2_9RHOO|nr:cytochrome c oxidase accessory protein CcoG [Pseudothauera nasutitermitis]THF61473.1 cytochrome c oxidase accessory protein CcoG [Pseudothauera nasutitermitis]